MGERDDKEHRKEKFNLMHDTICNHNLNFTIQLITQKINNIV